MNFSVALGQLKLGEKVRRSHWGSGSSISTGKTTHGCLSLIFNLKEEVLNDHWICNNEDLFAEDWEILFVDV